MGVGHGDENWLMQSIALSALECWLSGDTNMRDAALNSLRAYPAAGRELVERHILNCSGEIAQCTALLLEA